MTEDRTEYRGRRVDIRPTPIRKATALGLLAGLGVEDIAVQGGFKPDAVRFEVRRLRASGVLLGMIRQAKRNPRPGAGRAGADQPTERRKREG